MMAVLLLMTGCGTDEGGSVTTPSDSPAARTELTVTVRASEDAAPKTWTLTCDPPGGNHPDASSACSAISAAADEGDPFAPVPEDAVCTQMYGGPQTATVEGTWNGKAVNATFKRTNGCEIARWKKLSALFPVNTGVVPD